MEDESFGTVIRTILLVFLCLLLVVLGCCSVDIVPTGYTGVKSTLGQIEEAPLSSGVVVHAPLVQSVELVNNKQQDMTYDTRIWSETSERTAIYYEGITVTYTINPEYSVWILANVANYEDLFSASQLVASAVKASSKTLEDEAATNRAIIEPLVQEILQSSIDHKYREGVVTINKVTISNVDFDDAYDEAILEKQKAEIAAEQQAIENQRAIEKAEADAQVRKTNAQANADAILIEAEAEAKANEIIQESLTHEVLNQRYIDKWDGVLPEVMSPDAGIIVGME